MRALSELSKLSAVEIGGNVRAQTRRFKFAVNRFGKNKDWDFKDLAGKYRDIEGDIHTVAAEVKNGHALCAGLLGGKWRAKSNVIGSDWILLDIDNSKVLKDESGEIVKDADGKTIKVYDHQLTLDEAIAHPFIQRHCALIYTTASHRSDWHKFRLIFILPEYVSDIDVYESMVRLLMEHLPHDPSCKDASRVFYGSTEAEFPLIQSQAVLPSDWVERAIALGEAEKQARQQRIVEQQQRHAEFESIARSEGWDIDTLIRNALSHIPPRMLGSGNYEECRDVIAALTSYYGASAVAIAESWSPSIPGSTWNVERKVRSFERGCANGNGISYRTIFWLATKYRWQYPKSNRTFKEYDPINDPVYQAYIEAEQEQERCEEAEEKERNIRIFKGFCSRVRADKRRKVRDRAPEIATEQSKKQRYVPGNLPDYQPGLKLPTFTLRTMSDRNLFVYEAFEKGWKHVLDRSGTGSGKSHFAGYLEPEKFGENLSLWYLTNESRNPSTETIEHNFVELPVRHQGMEPTEKRTPSGRVVMKPVIDGMNAGNCQFAHLHLAAGQKGFNSEVEAANNPICGGCPHNRPLDGETGSRCANHEGEGYGFRTQRRDGMTASRIRLNSQSAPADLPNKLVAIWEEFGTQNQPVVRTTTASELNTEWWMLEEQHPGFYELLKPLRKILAAEIANPSSHWGVTRDQILQKIQELNLPLFRGDSEIKVRLRTQFLAGLKTILKLDLNQLMAIESQNNSELRKQVESAVRRVESLFRHIEKCEAKIKQLESEIPSPVPQTENAEKRMRSTVKAYWALKTKEMELRAQFEEALTQCDRQSEEYEAAKRNTQKQRGEQAQAARQRLENAPTQALYNIIEMVCLPSQGLGNFRIHNGKIVLTLPNERIQTLVKGASFNLYTDATVDETVLKHQLEIENLLICELEQEAANNIKHFQVLGYGKCSKNRAQSTNEKLKQLHQGIREREAAKRGIAVEVLKVEIADYKVVEGFEAKIRHLSNSRGSNEIAGTQVLIVHGLPKPNQGAIEDEYTCLEKPEFSFEQFYQYKVDSEIKQLAGRQRNERPEHRDQQFAVYWVNEDLLPFEVEQIEAIDICYQAAPKQQRIAQSVFEAVCEAARLGLKLTQKLIAQFADCTQGFVSKWFRDRGGWTYWRDLLFEKTAEDIEQYRSQLEPQEATIAAILPSELEHATEAEEVLEIVSALFEGFGTDGFRRIWKAIGWKTRRRFFAALLIFGLPPEVWHEPVNT
jgi:hypothetical protein